MRAAVYRVFEESGLLHEVDLAVQSGWSLWRITCKAFAPVEWDTGAHGARGWRRTQTTRELTVSGHAWGVDPEDAREAARSGIKAAKDAILREVADDLASPFEIEIHLFASSEELADGLADGTL